MFSAPPSTRLLIQPRQAGYVLPFGEQGQELPLVHVHLVFDLCWCV